MTPPKLVLSFVLACVATGCSRRGACVTSWVRDATGKPITFECANDFEDRTCGAEFHLGKTCEEIGYTEELGRNQFRRP